MEEMYWIDRIMREGEVAESHWVVHQLADNGGGLSHMIFCPACQCGHGFDTKRWVFNGDMVKPTLSPVPNATCSVLVNHFDYRKNQKIRCHFHLTDGIMQFCDDCTHEFAGKNVPLEPF